MTLKKKFLVVCGATASGKTSFAVSLAQKLGGEVVSADCMLVYKRMNIGTAKPTADEMQGVCHHMIDIAEPTEKYSVSDYENAALPICENLFSKNVPPVICGGTGFYIQSLLFSRTNGGAGGDESIRREYEKVAQTRGREYLHGLLREVDPQSAEKLHPNDVKRVIRALEIYRLTGRKKSEQNDGFSERYPYVAVAFQFPRDELYARIDRRADEMLAAGLVDEVRDLLDAGVTPDCQSMQGIGYKEVVKYLKNEISYSTMCDIIKQNTRNYAKRQITLFKKFPGLIWLDPRDEGNLQKVAEYYEKL